MLINENIEVEKALLEALNRVDFVKEVFNFEDKMLITLPPFNPVVTFKEDGVNIYVTDQPEFIEVLKELGLKGSRRSEAKYLNQENIPQGERDEREQGS